MAIQELSCWDVTLRRMAINAMLTFIKLRLFVTKITQSGSSRAREPLQCLRVMLESLALRLGKQDRLSTSPLGWV